MNITATRWIDGENPHWIARVKATDHDVNHLPTFLNAEDRFRGTETRLLITEEGVAFAAIPLIVTRNEYGLFDASSPHYFSAPIFSDDSTASWRQTALRRMLEYLRDEEIVTLFLRFHPLLDIGPDAFSGLGVVVNEGSTYDISLTDSLTEIRGRMRQNHRRNIRKAREAGLFATIDAEWRYLDEFHRIYALTMDRLNSHPKYCYSREYFEFIRDEVGEASLWVLEADGELAGAHLVTECDGKVQYFLGATNPDLAKRVPQAVIFDSVLEWAHERDNRNYFLGGGIQESLLHFKAGFTQETRPFYTARIVVDPVAYGRLCGEWESRTGKRVAAGMDAFFPAYRQP